MLPDELVKTKGLRMKIVPSRDGVSSAMGFTSTATVNVELLGRKFVAQINCELVSESGVRLRETNKSVRIYTNSTDLVSGPPLPPAAPPLHAPSAPVLWSVSFNVRSCVARRSRRSCSMSAPCSSHTWMAT